jgi:hypothetical protein
MIPQPNLFIVNLKNKIMSKYSHLKIVTLFIGPLLLAQTPPTKTASADSSNGTMPSVPTSTPAVLPTTVAPGPAIVREDLTPEQKRKNEGGRSHESRKSFD